jgi:hypothetical protein
VKRQFDPVAIFVPSRRDARDIAAAWGLVKFAESMKIAGNNPVILTRKR